MQYLVVQVDQRLTDSLLSQEGLFPVARVEGGQLFRVPLVQQTLALGMVLRLRGGPLVQQAGDLCRSDSQCGNNIIPEPRLATKHGLQGLCLASRRGQHGPICGSCALGDLLRPSRLGLHQQLALYSGLLDLALKGAWYALDLFDDHVHGGLDLGPCQPERVPDTGRDIIERTTHIADSIPEPSHVVQGVIDESGDRFAQVGKEVFDHAKVTRDDPHKPVQAINRDLDNVAKQVDE